MPLAVVTYFLVLTNFKSGGSVAHDDGGKIHSGVYLIGSVASVDPTARTLKIDLSVVPRGDYAAPRDINRLAQPLDLYINDERGASETPLDTAGVLSEIPVTVPLSGEITDYPFDKYRGHFQIYLLSREARDAPDRFDRLVPVELKLLESAHGFAVDLEAFKSLPGQASKESDNYNLEDIEVQVHRASASKFFAIFVMVLMVALALASLAIALVLTHWGREIGAGVLGFLAALLFAFPAVRSVMPGTPPVGSYSDFLAFFWAEAVVALTLFALAVIWLTREMRDGRSVSSTALAPSGPPPGPPTGPPPGPRQPPPPDPPPSSPAGPPRPN